MSIVTGAEDIAKDLGMKVGSALLEQLGVARKARPPVPATPLHVAGEGNGNAHV